MSQEKGCAGCSWRAKYDARPSSLLGRLWRWHANFCPGWKKYASSLGDEERRSLEQKYGFPAGRFSRKPAEPTPDTEPKDR